MNESVRRVGKIILLPGVQLDDTQAMEYQPDESEWRIDFKDTRLPKLSWIGWMRELKEEVRPLLRKNELALFLEHYEYFLHFFLYIKTVSCYQITLNPETLDKLEQLLNGSEDEQGLEFFNANYNKIIGFDELKCYIQHIIRAKLNPQSRE